MDTADNFTACCNEWEKMNMLFNEKTTILYVMDEKLKEKNL
jgi:hypothetical protein